MSFAFQRQHLFMFPHISSRLGQGVIALQLPSNLREAVRKYHDPPCRRRVQLAKLGSDYMNRSGYAIVALLPCRSCMGFVLEIAIMHLSKIKRISFKCFLHLCASSLAVFHPHITRSHPFAEPQSLSVSWEKSCFALIIACSYLFRKKLKFIIFL